MSINPPGDTNEVEPVNILNGVRYLFRDAIRDFGNAFGLARKRRNNEITDEEFSAEMDRRFPANREARPNP